MGKQTKILFVAASLAVIQPAWARDCKTGIGSPRVTRSAMVSFEQCVDRAALRLERSREQADQVAIAAIGSCDIELETAMSLLESCHGSEVRRLARPMAIDKAKDRATTLVVTKRANRP